MNRQLTFAQFHVFTNRTEKMEVPQKSVSFTKNCKEYPTSNILYTFCILINMEKVRNIISRQKMYEEEKDY